MNALATTIPPALPDGGTPSAGRLQLLDLHLLRDRDAAKLLDVRLAPKVHAARKVRSIASLSIPPGAFFFTRRGAPERSHRARDDGVRPARSPRRREQAHSRSCAPHVRRRATAPRTGLARGACTSARTARSSDASGRLVRVEHPFHPLGGRQLVCVGERYNRYGARLLLRTDDDRVCSVPPQWTDVVTPDPEIVLSEGRSPFRVADLVELADLVSRLVGQERQGVRGKANDAACVRSIPPQGADLGASCSAYFGLVVRHVDEGRPLDTGTEGGVVVVTNKPEKPCRSEPTAQTPRPRPSSRRAR